MEVELLPGKRQTLWGWPAVANFFLGGAGAGAYLAAAVSSSFQRSPLLTAASVLAPALVVAGFLCVAAEAGRPSRGPFVLARARTSWMSRELWAGGALSVLALADLLRPFVLFRAGAVLAAFLLAFAQGAMLRQARGMSAWSAWFILPLFVTSALASGAGVGSVVHPFLGSDGEGVLGGWTAVLVALSFLAWVGYLTWPGDFAFRRATASFKAGGTALEVFGVGHLLPLVLLAAGAWSSIPVWSALAGVAVLVGQLRAKGWLILRAGELRPVTIRYLRGGAFAGREER